MPAVILGLSLVASGGVMGASASASAPMVRAADDDRPHRRSRELEHGQPHVQMGAGPTALAMLAFVAAAVARSVRRRRGGSVVD